MKTTLSIGRFYLNNYRKLKVKGLLAALFSNRRMRNQMESRLEAVNKALDYSDCCSVEVTLCRSKKCAN
jgi:hypothetical protein